MKSLIISIGSILGIALRVCVSMVICPFIAWILSGCEVYWVSMGMLEIFSVCLWVHVLIGINRYLYSKKWKKVCAIILSLFPPIAVIHLIVLIVKKHYWALIWMPIIIANILSAFLLYKRYQTGSEDEGYYVIYDFFNGNEGVSNKFGVTVIEPEYSWIHSIRRGNATIRDYRSGYEEWGIYSLEEKRFILPMGETIKTYGTIEERNGVYGIVSLEGDILVPFTYEKIEFEDNGYAIVKKDGLYGMIDRQGYVVVHCDNVDCRIRGQVWDNSYYAFEDRNGYKELWRYENEEMKKYFARKYDYLVQVVDNNRFVLEKDNTYGVVDKGGHTIIPFEYSDIHYDEDYRRFRCRIEYPRGYQYCYYDIDGKFTRKETYAW